MFQTTSSASPPSTSCEMRCAIAAIVQAMSEVFQVSRQAMRIRLTNHHLL